MANEEITEVMAASVTYRRGMARTTIFLGSFLAFLVQPLVARALLPVFGGSASVWVTCLAAFQLLLVAGYAYAHLLASGRLVLHLSMLALSVAWLAALSLLFKPIAHWIGLLDAPMCGTLASVAIFAGLPYILLAANASMVQRLAGGAYRLYAVSNIGSFAGLFIHPLVFEQYVPMAWQWAILAAGCLVYTILLFMTSRRIDDGIVAVQDSGAETRPSVHLSPLILFLPAVSCFMLNAATAHVTSNVTPLPLLWAVFLGVYLLTFAVGFSAWGERLLPLWALLGVASAGWAAFARFGEPLSPSRLASEMGAALSLVFFGGSAIHAWLCRLRPAAVLLTRYNLAIAIGGAVGGLLSGVVVPCITNSIIEWPVTLVVLAAVLVVVLRNWTVRRFGTDRFWATWAGIGAVAVVTVAVWTDQRQSHHGDIARGRSFYGEWRVCHDMARNNFGKMIEVYAFKHGGTLHGFEPVNPIYRDEATAYYGSGGGGLAFTTHPLYRAGSPVRAGIVGLGIGTLAFYGRTNDVLRFYEICPQVTAVANGPWFDYLRNCSSRVDVVEGDARRALEAERTSGTNKWDILVIDAYSGDAIPLQLMTEEAFRLYRDRLASGGTLALHLSNWHIDLIPAAKSAAKLLDLSCQVVIEPPTILSCPSVWAFLAEHPLNLPEKTKLILMDDVPDMPLPRDDCGGLLPFVKMLL